MSIVSDTIILKSKRKFGGLYCEYRVTEVFEEAKDILAERLDIGQIMHVKLSDLRGTDEKSERWLKIIMDGNGQ